MRCASPPASVPDVAVERQVVEADVEQELQPLEHFLEHALGDHAVALADSSTVLEERDAVADRQLADLEDVLVADGDRERRGPQPRAHRTPGTAPGACSPR